MKSRFLIKKCKLKNVVSKMNELIEREEPEVGNK